VPADLGHGAATAADPSDSGPNILCVHQGHELYGSDRSFVTSVAILRDALPAATVDVLLPRDGPLAASLRGMTGVRTFVADIGSLRSADAARPWTLLRRTLAAARRAVVRGRPYDVLYINTVVVADFILASRFIRARSVVHVREIPSSPAARLAFSLLLAASPAFMIFNSEETRRAYRFLRPAACAVVHNGVEGFDAGPIDPDPTAPLRILVIGRINAWKGQGFLVDAVAHLAPEERRRVQVRIVGDTPEGQSEWRERLEARIRALRLADVVELAPFVEDPGGHYRWADVVAVPSTRPEPFGRVAVEAMSARRAVVAAAHGGLREIVVHGATGLLFRPNDAEDLLVCLRSLLTDRARLAAMGAAGRARFEAQFSVDAYRERLLRALRRALP
jgi:glycosyltransferase involved in cell wall biosynthesis